MDIYIQEINSRRKALAQLRKAAVDVKYAIRRFDSAEDDGTDGRYFVEQIIYTLRVLTETMMRARPWMYESWMHKSEVNELKRVAEWGIQELKSLDMYRVDSQEYDRRKQICDEIMEAIAVAKEAFSDPP